ncbi:MAG: proline dehydrogenase family protein [Flavobacteriales bacterium]|nr:proline dehydrogenase family protein [Flavobacteriales bacterium]
MDFNNTEIAFSGKSNTDLKRSYWLFKIIGWSWLIKLGPVLLKIFMPLWFPIPIIKATIFKQFCGGESIEECENTIDELSTLNVKTILDYSVEGKEEESVFDANVEEALSAIKKAKSNPNIPFSVFKPTGFGRFDLLQKINNKQPLTQNEEAEFDRIKIRIDKMCAAGFDADIPIFIDAEETWIQNPVDDIALEMMRKYNKEKAIVYNTAQMYRWDRIAYLKELKIIAENEGFYIGMKLVRGAYIEQERERAQKMGYNDPMQKTQENTDKDYDLAIKFCVENINKIALCCASHNEKSNLLLVDLMKEHNIDIDDNRIYFAQLLGMSDHISNNMGKGGYNVAKYVPYGPVKDVTPYLIRRAEENTSIAGQTGRELALILSEQRRRKSI